MTGASDAVDLFGRTAVSRRRLITVGANAALVAGLLSRTPARTAHAQSLNGYLDGLGEAVRAAMDESFVPGAAVGLLAPGVEYVAGFGVTNVDYPQAVDIDTVFLIASVTKTYTATAVLRLVDRGRLDLDVPVRAYLPELQLADPEATTRVTLRHLLTHTSGLPTDNFVNMGDGADALAHYVDQMAELPLVLPVGRYPSYSNAGIALAARVLEVATQQSYEGAVHELLFAPLGMSQSSFFAEHIVYYPTAVGHTVVDGRPMVQRPWRFPRTANAFGGMISSVGDQLRYARFWLGDGTAPDGRRLLSPEAMRAMTTLQVDNYGYEGTSGYGFGWGVTKLDGSYLASHDGGAIGQLSRLQVAPQHGYALCVLTNAAEGGAVMNAAQAWAMEHVLQVSPASPPPEREVQAISTTALAAHAGTYVNTGEAEQAIRVVDGELELIGRWTDPFMVAVRPPIPIDPPQRLAFYAPDEFRAVDVPALRVLFLRNRDGAIDGFFLGGRYYKRQS